MREKLRRGQKATEIDVHVSHTCTWYTAYECVIEQLSWERLFMRGDETGPRGKFEECKIRV